MQETLENHLSEEFVTGKMIDLHIAEYATLTNRVTNWINVQFGILSLVFLYFGFIISQYKNISIIVTAWSCLFVAQLALGMCLLCSSELYRIVLYIEKNLRSELDFLLTSRKSFWSYETALSSTYKGDKTRYLKREILLFAVAVFIFWFAISLRTNSHILNMIFISIPKKTWTNADTFGISINLLVAIFLVLTENGIIKIRRELHEQFQKNQEANH